LTLLGTLSELTVDTISLDNSTISRTGGNQGLTIQANAGDISVSSSKIVDLAEPTNDFEASNKIYTDREVALDPIVMSVDVTNWISPDIVNNELISLLEQLYPATPFADGKQARILATYYQDQVVSGINIDAASTKSFTNVEAAGGGTVTVLQDVGLPSSASGTFTPTVQREIRTYEIKPAGGGVSTWQVA